MATIATIAALAPLAQWQSNGLLIRRFWVRIPEGALQERLGRRHISSSRIDDDRLPHLPHARTRPRRQRRRPVASAPTRAVPGLQPKDRERWWAQNALNCRVEGAQNDD